jgi:hypothetical protein
LRDGFAQLTECLAELLKSLFRQLAPGPARDLARAAHRPWLWQFKTTTQALRQAIGLFGQTGHAEMFHRLPQVLHSLVAVHVARGTDFAAPRTVRPALGLIFSRAARLAPRAFGVGFAAAPEFVFQPLP